MPAPESMRIKFDDKPNLTKLMQENPGLAKEVIGTFVSLMEEACDPGKGIQWAHLPKLLHRNLNFSSLIKGILHGALDVKGMNPEAYEAIGIEVHPMAMLSPRKSDLTPGKTRYIDWRKHWLLSSDTDVNEQTVTDIIRRMFRYTKYIPLEQFAEALDAEQVAAYRGLGNIAVRALPFTPALRYQKEHFGDLHVGTFYSDFGFFDCGKLPENAENCPACQHSLEDTVRLNGYIGCLSCNGGFDL